MLHGMAHNLCPLAVPTRRSPRPQCSSLLACALEFSSLGNQTHVYTVTKRNKCNNNYFLNGTEPYIFILFLKDILCNIFLLYIYPQQTLFSRFLSLC